MILTVVGAKTGVVTDEYAGLFARFEPGCELSRIRIFSPLVGDFYKIRMSSKCTKKFSFDAQTTCETSASQVR